jgi:NADH-quinone oxidoreductase subunit L
LAGTKLVLAVQRFWHAGWGFDWLYHTLLVRPFLYLTRINKNDFIDAFYRGITRLTQYCHQGLSQTQTGKVRWYTGGVAAGTAILIAMAVFL